MPMDIAPFELTIYNELQVCPFCNKRLEINPNSGNKACFAHGDFIVKSIDGKVTIEFSINALGFISSGRI